MKNKTKKSCCPQRSLYAELPRQEKKEQKSSMVAEIFAFGTLMKGRGGREGCAAAYPSTDDFEEKKGKV